MKKILIALGTGMLLSMAQPGICGFGQRVWAVEDGDGAEAAPVSVETGLEEEVDMETPEGPEISAPSALLMEASTGQVIYEKNADKQRSPASITKIMTLILIFDAIDSGKIKMDDQVVTSAYAKSMGGSQVFLEDADIIGRKWMTGAVIGGVPDTCPFAGLCRGKRDGCAKVVCYGRGISKAHAKGPAFPFFGGRFSLQEGDRHRMLWLYGGVPLFLGILHKIS